MYRFSAFAALLLIIMGICLACNYHNAPPKKPIEEPPATINLSAVIHSRQDGVLHEVKLASQLPSAVLDELGGVADKGQPFNCTCTVDRKLPMAELVAAAVSEKYCIVSYWSGTFVCGSKTRLFELSKGRVKRVWAGWGCLNFLDLKETVESGHMVFTRIQREEISRKMAKMLLDAAKVESDARQTAQRQRP
jgi:hypothetical protein